MKRPSQLIFGIDDKPNVKTLIFLGLQYVVIISAFLLLPVIVMQEAHVSPHLAEGVISTAMLVAGFTAILQVFRQGLIGSGYLILASPNPVYIAPSIIAIQLGGLPMVFAMTLFAGIVQIVLAPFFKELQKFFPAEIGGLIMALIGVDIGMLGINNFITIFSSPLTDPAIPAFISLFTLTIILIMTLWGSKFFRLYALFIALVLGYVLIYFSGYMNPNDILQIKQAAWLALPSFPALTVGYTFNSSLMISFIIAALACSIKVSGAVTAQQRLNDDEWHEPEMRSIGRGSLVDGIGTLLCGILGSFGQNTSSSALGLSLSAGIGSRLVAYSFAAIFALLSFSPKFALILVLAPSSIVAVILIFLAATLLVNGLKTIIPRMTVSHRAVVIGISFMLGVSREIYPETYQHLPNILQTMTGSSIALATISAIILNFIALLSIDNTKIARIMLHSDSTGYNNGLCFLESLKKDWDLPSLVFDHVQDAFRVLMNTFIKQKITPDLITFDVQFTRSQLDLTVCYKNHQESKNIVDELIFPKASATRLLKNNDASTLQLNFDY